MGWILIGFSKVVGENSVLNYFHMVLFGLRTDFQNGENWDIQKNTTKTNRYKKTIFHYFNSLTFEMKKKKKKKRVIRGGEVELKK